MAFFFPRRVLRADDHPPVFASLVRARTVLDSTYDSFNF
jgi:hypothetical protein